jgi:hypothetical protein
MSKELTRRQAKELSIKKWEWIVSEGGNVMPYQAAGAIPELEYLDNYCGFCELYFKDRSCKGCPLNLKNKVYSEEDNCGCGCHEKNHPYDNWMNNSTVENAQVVLDLINKAIV